MKTLREEIEKIVDMEFLNENKLYPDMMTRIRTNQLLALFESEVEKDREGLIEEIQRQMVENHYEHNEWVIDKEVWNRLKTSLKGGKGEE